MEQTVLLELQAQSAQLVLQVQQEHKVYQAPREPQGPMEQTVQLELQAQSD